MGSRGRVGCGFNEQANPAYVPNFGAGSVEDISLANWRIRLSQTVNLGIVTATIDFRAAQAFAAAISQTIGRAMATIVQFFRAPLEGRLSVSKVFWVYGVIGSLLYGCLEFIIDPSNSFLMRAYTIGGFLYSAYVIVGTYRCAVNCKTPRMARFVRVSCVISLLLLPFLTYMELSGALDSELSQLDQLNY